MPDGEWEKQTLLGFEREMLGLYVSDHPLLGMEHALAAETDCSVAQLLSATDEPERSSRGDRAVTARWSRSAGSCPASRAR